MKQQDREWRNPSSDIDHALSNIYSWGGVGWDWVHFVRQPRMIEESLAAETEVLRENLTHCHFVYNKPHMT
jgi:hypothetical protein